MTLYSTINKWIKGTRPNTLLLSFSPIICGTIAAKYQKSWNFKFAFLCLLVAILLQIGTNYANDYFDGIRGVDDSRKGSQRMVGAGVTLPYHVKIAAILSITLASILGLLLLIISNSLWPLLLIGIFCVIAAWCYTGGKNPYGYNGLGEIFVFVFFGIVATSGTEYIQAKHLSFLSLILGASLGFFAAAVLLINNIRDINNDAKNNKNTLAVKIGYQKSKIVYLILIFLPYIFSYILYLMYDKVFLFPLISILLIVKPSIMIINHSDKCVDFEFILKRTGIISFVYSNLLILGILIKCLS